MIKHHYQEKPNRINSLVALGKQDVLGKFGLSFYDVDYKGYSTFEELMTQQPLKTTHTYKKITVHDQYFCFTQLT